jgi:Carbohydrate-selective porin, OprB family
MAKLYLGVLVEYQSPASGLRFAEALMPGPQNGGPLVWNLHQAILGDGGLKYVRETLMEAYYTAHLWRGLYVGPDAQYIVNPGYN